MMVSDSILPAVRNLWSTSYSQQPSGSGSGLMNDWTLALIYVFPIFYGTREKFIAIGPPAKKDPGIKVPKKKKNRAVKQKPNAEITWRAMHGLL
jgi:hypothetical protein